MYKRRLFFGSLILFCSMPTGWADERYSADQQAASEKFTPAQTQIVPSKQTDCQPQNLFPKELVQFQQSVVNPVFQAGGKGKWDTKIRERGWIIKSGATYRMWYTGYDGTRTGQRMLGYATSTDGIDWKRHPQNPINKEHWIEDMMIVEHEKTLYMFAEGREDQPHFFRSLDGITWKRVGPLDIRLADGSPIPSGPTGTLVARFDQQTKLWQLFYERYDIGIWLATSADMKVWTNISDEPVIKLGPHPYDDYQVALNQILEHKGKYYAYYHGMGTKAPWDKWNINIAVSDDLIQWTKYKGNPLLPVEQNKSSGILVHDGSRYRLYTMHDQVALHWPVQQLMSSENK